MPAKTIKRTKTKAPKCIAEGCENLAEGSGSGRGYCPRCYRRELRAKAGEGKLLPGQVQEAIGDTKGARELRALFPGATVKAFDRLVKRDRLEPAELLRRAVKHYLVTAGELQA